MGVLLYHRVMNKIIGVLPAVLLFASSAMAEKIFVEPTKGTGIDQSDLASTTSLIQSAVTQAGHQLESRSSEADGILRPEVLKLGKSYILKISEVKKGEVIATDQLKAETIEEMDKVASRVTTAVLNHQQSANTGKVGEITNQESHEGTQRHPVRNVTYFGIGAALLANMNTGSGVGYNISAGAGWDSTQSLLKIILDISGLKGAALFSLGLGGDYFLNTNNIAPYVGGIFGYGSSKTAGNGTSGILTEAFGETVSGFILSPEVGVQFMRTSQTSLDLSFHAEYLLRSNAFGSPAAYVLRLGISY